MNLTNEKISVIGAVRSGVGAAKLIKKLGGKPFVSDSGFADKFKKSMLELQKNNIEFEFGNHSNRVYDCTLIVVSPGVPSDSEVIKTAKSKGIKIISEIELASRFCAGNIIAITGTNGKTTATSLCSYLFNHCGVKTYSAGNIGNAFSEITLDVKKNEFVSLEVSSFQLDYIETFKPKVSVILNITPDHLNRYENKLENYIQSKLRIYCNQTKEDYLIINNDDLYLQKNISGHLSKTYYFSLTNNIANGCYLNSGNIYYVENRIKKFECKTTDIQLRGEHNWANAMAVISAAKIFDLDNGKIISALKTFKAVEHRLELVKEINGVKFINDSKATNVDSVIYALKSFNTPIHLILGGLDKGNNYKLIEELVKKNVKQIYAIGSSSDKIKDFFSNQINVKIYSSLQEATENAYKNAHKNEVVLLSPACASYDMFENYEDRGNQFKQIVKNI
ncbi:MAG: UDP-N-acetylmuramoyl-L-alanine--D-glutamate ligase [Ignavibacteriales bacterium CG_4_9_14_3_um_filter_30_11]|nr:MAG: UDP-N-acetylmuramoyl-L-alanine--D-glutamate ligase [Ignavibacteriales bacterium CG_4_9_14_3_um_filter_30_11]